jgi:hypothetical protein
MMDRQDRFGWQVKQWLNRSAMEVSPSVNNRLEQARLQALARQRKASRKVLVEQSLLVTERMVRKTASPFEGWFAGMGAAAPAMAVALGLFFLSDAQVTGEARRMADIDAMVLGDELPISAYLDDGFSAFLKQAELQPAQPNAQEEAPAAEPMVPAKEKDRDLKRI